MGSKAGKKRKRKAEEKREKKPEKKAKGEDEQRKVENERVSTTFFIMPAEALRNLRDELSPLASELAVRAVLFRYGFRSGEAYVQSRGIKAIEPEELRDVLPVIWAEIGLGRLRLINGGKEDFALQLDESMEANVIGEIGQTSCDFTRGYLAGIVSYLSGIRYHCREEKCISKGDRHCAFLLSNRGKRMRT